MHLALSAPSASIPSPRSRQWQYVLVQRPVIDTGVLAQLFWVRERAQCVEAFGDGASELRVDFGQGVG
jgi:hypothetical protein